MARERGRGRWAARFVDHPWLWPAVTVAVLLVVATALVAVAREVHDNSEPGGFARVLASGALSGAGVAVFGAAITGLLTVAAEIRARTERTMTKRLELFQRMRAAHVRVALGQQLLRTQADVETYRAQMQDLMQVTKDLEEIREEVRVSGKLYADRHRRLIMTGIARIIVFLQVGIAEYTAWCREATEVRGRCRSARSRSGDHRAGAWLIQLVAERESPESRLDPGDEEWEPRGTMPPDYDHGLFASKLVMRAYVYGSREGLGEATAR